MPARTVTATARAHRAGHAARPWRHAVVLTALLCGQLMLVLDVTVMNVALPRIRTDLGFSATGLSWVMNAYTLAFGGLLLLGGRLGDIAGRRRMFLAGVGLFTVASLAGGLATSPTWLVAARIAQGVGAAAAGPSVLALLTTTFTEPRERVRALALFSGTSSAGFAIGLILGGLLTQWLSWRSVMFVNVPIGVAVALVAARLMDQPERHPSRLDLPGAVTGSAGVAAAVYGFIHAASSGWSDARTQAFLAAGALLLTAFLVVESRVAQPLVPMRLFADRNRAAAYVNFFFGPMVGMSMFFFLTQYLQDVHDYSALATGFAFLPLAVALFAMTRLIPHLLPRFGPRPLAVTGTVTMAVGLVILTRLSVGSGYVPLVFVPMVLMGLGMGLAFSPLNVVIMSSVSPREAGSAGGVLQTMQQTGGSLGLAVLVTVFGTAARHAAGAGEPARQVLVSGVTHAFVGSAIVAGLTVLVALTFRGPAPAG